jgi:hypothetical protein
VWPANPAFVKTAQGGRIDGDKTVIASQHNTNEQNGEISQING